jgi:hypothetical protein
MILQFDAAWTRELGRHRLSKFTELLGALSVLLGDNSFSMDKQ